MEEHVISTLLGNVPLAGFVGTRIYWGLAPQGAALPYVTLQVISGSPDYASTGTTGVVEARIQVDCYGATYGQAKRTLRAAQTALKNYKRLSGTPIVQGVFLDGERDFSERRNDATIVHKASSDFFIWHA